MSKLVYGVGINDADYVTQIKEELGVSGGKRKQKVVWICPFYTTWKNMLRRGYSNKFKIKQPTYKDVTVCEEWHRFSTFRAWMQAQCCEGSHLDKDLLVPGNKVYSPESCVFVSRQVNNFFLDRGNDRGDYKIGVDWHKQSGKFKARCNNPITGSREYLGLFESEEVAHQAWLSKKLEHAYALAATQTDPRVAKALIARYENYGECNV